MIKRVIGWLLVGIFSPVVFSDTALLMNVTGNRPLNTVAHNGFLDRVSIAMFSRIGKQIELVRLPAERALLNANAGLIDGEISRIEGLEKIYPNLVRIPETIMTWEFMAFSRRDMKTLTDWSSLKGKSVGIINGWKILEKNVPPDVELIKVRNAEQLFRLLFRNRVDIIIYEKWSGLYKIKQASETGYRIHSQPLVKRLMFVYLNQKHRQLVVPLQKALQQMKHDGLYQKYRKLILMPVSHE